MEYMIYHVFNFAVMGVNAPRPQPALGSFMQGCPYGNFPISGILSLQVPYRFRQQGAVYS